MMKAIVIIAFMLCLTHINCQDLPQACVDASIALTSGMPSCAQQFAAQDSAVCSGTCADLYRDFIAACAEGDVSYILSIL